MILGASGSGKSASLRNFEPDKVGLFNVAGKPLPFRSKIKSVDGDDPAKIAAQMRSAKAKSLVIDDSQYVMANEFMRRADEKGFQKFTDIGKNFWSLIRSVKDLPPDTIVYFLQHTESDADGREKAKTIGKMLDEKITVEGLFTIVLKAVVVDGMHYFRTKTTGNDPVKAPIGMFGAELIDNDLRLVDDTIRDYYGLTTESGGKGKGDNAKTEKL